MSRLLEGGVESRLYRLPYAVTGWANHHTAAQARSRRAHLHVLHPGTTVKNPFPSVLCSLPSQFPRNYVCRRQPNIRPQEHYFSHKACSFEVFPTGRKEPFYFALRRASKFAPLWKSYYLSQDADRYLLRSFTLIGSPMGRNMLFRYSSDTPSSFICLSTNAILPREPITPI